MIIDCIADTHGHFPKLEGGDLLIVAGDLTSNDRIDQNELFRQWIKKQSYKKKIVIAGNHDNLAQKGFYNNPESNNLYKLDYLCDSGTEFEGLKIWGSPWTKTFEGMNPACKAFTVDTEEDLAEKWALIPKDTDILITHSPPKYGLDRTIDQEFVGSESLKDWIFIQQPKLHAFGHVHESYGIITHQTIQDINFKITGKINDKLCRTTIVNASHVNELFMPVNKPLRIIL